MYRIVEILVGLNAIGGIAAFLGFRYAGRKARDRIQKVFGKDDDREDGQDGRHELPSP
jgi:hypothetical protein